MTTTLKFFILCAFLSAFSAFANDRSAVTTVPVDLTSAADSVDEVDRSPASVDAGHAKAGSTAVSDDTTTAGTDYSVPDYIDDPKTIDREPRGSVESMPPSRHN